MSVYRIDVQLSIGGRKVNYTTSGNLETLTDEVIIERFEKNHKIGSKQGKVSVISKTQGQILGNNGVK